MPTFAPDKLVLPQAQSLPQGTYRDRHTPEESRELYRALTPEQRSHWDFDRAKKDADGIVTIPGKNGDSDILILPTQKYKERYGDTGGIVRLEKGTEVIAFPSYVVTPKETDPNPTNIGDLKELFPQVTDKLWRQSIIVHEMTHYLEDKHEFGAFRKQFDYLATTAGKPTVTLSDSIVAAIILGGGYTRDDHIQASLEASKFQVTPELLSRLPGGEEWRENRREGLLSPNLSAESKAEIEKDLTLSRKELFEKYNVGSSIQHAITETSAYAARESVGLNNPKGRQMLERGLADRNDPQVQRYNAARSALEDKLRADFVLSLNGDAGLMPWQ